MLATDTQDTFEVIVSEDTKKPREQQRRIVCPYMSMRQLAAYRKLNAATFDTDEDDAYMAAQSAVLLAAKPKFEGPWQTLEGESMPEMTLATCIELCDAIPTVQMMTEVDRKKSARQSPSASANSAAAAAA